MSQLFEIVESYPEKLTENFKLTDSSPSNYSLLRLMIGDVQLTNMDTEDTIQSSKNYISLFYEYDSELTLEKNLCNILGESFEVDDLAKFFFDSRYKNKNIEFFRRLENEVCNFLSYQSRGGYTTAFIFLYRILEVISFSFPLIYASKTYDFKHTYGKLKEMFNSNKGSNQGERGFLKSAIKVMFSSSDLLETSIDINIEDVEYEKREKIFKAIRSIFKDEKIFHEDTVENSNISIKFGEVSSFIINLRNRFFHLFNRGDKNLESIEIIDPDFFFSKLNEPLFSWICVVYVEIIRFLLEEHEKYVR
jgi:hypothetical protein